MTPAKGTLSPKNLSKADYIKKIAVATPAQLAVINFDLLLDFFDDAESHWTDEERFEKALEKARLALRELAAALDARYDLSFQLAALYLYVNRLLVTEVKKKNLAALSDIRNIIAILREGFAQIQLADETEPGVSKLFAGLTYNSKGELDEYFNPSNQNDYKV